MFLDNSIIPNQMVFMLFFCQLLLNFQGAYALIQVRSLSLIRLHYELPDCMFPYKHDGTQSVEDVVDEVVSSEDLEIEVIPVKEL